MQVNSNACSCNMLIFVRTIFVIMRRGGGRFSVSIASTVSLSIGVEASDGVEGSSMLSLSAMVIDAPVIL
jgi:hypothetical protein